MASVTHQTVKLSKGQHSSPGEGACVMELASMLAGEPFSDHPVSVCPVIGSFLRSYNDFVDDERRQDLYMYAARVVDSRGSGAIQNARAERLALWIANFKRRGWRWSFVPRPLAWFAGVALDPVDIGAVFALRGRDAETHVEVLALLEELLAIGASERDATRAPASECRREAEPELTAVT